MTNIDTVNQNVIGLAALIISLVALFTTVVQVLQQFFSSAEGYRRCADSVMGLWAKKTHRRLRWNEFRVEVVFETPVIFLAPPSNPRGPILDRPIHYIDGTPESYTNTKVREPAEQKVADKAAIQRVRTADDERASWVTLLSALQQEERESRDWDVKECRKAPPKERLSFSAPDYGLAVGLQVKKRSWDFVPASITRPYATSAICHVVEMTAMLGMYWKVFDQIQWNLRAEGNGFIMTSTVVHGLGVMFTFAVTGRSKFQDDRVIPVEAIKELSFGNVPNIFDDTEYLQRIKDGQKDDPDSQSLSLMFGNENDVDSTLESLGCTYDVLKRYRQDHKHIFSVSFELIGMLGKVFRQRGSNFRMIPNPTQDFWLKKVGAKAAWKITTLMDIFQAKLRKLSEPEGFNEDHSIAIIIKQWRDIESFFDSTDGSARDELKLTLEAREAIHNALDEITDLLLTTYRENDILDVLTAHLDEVTKVLAKPNSALNSIVLAHKEEPFLNYYFDTIRVRVCGHQENANPLNRTDSSPNLELPSKSQEEKRNIIWISLIYRMLLWFLLHDWHKDDKCNVPSDLKGSRMPVYIG